jgi:hypothetical protein
VQEFFPRRDTSKVNGCLLVKQPGGSKILLERFRYKEKHHVDDYYNSGSFVGARLFRAEHQFQFPENRQLDSYFARNCPGALYP